jgi:integrase
MPLKLIAPKAGRNPNFRVRGTHMGCYVDRTCGTAIKAVAQKVLASIKAEIEAGRLAQKGDPTFSSAAMAYISAGGERRFIAPLNDYFGATLLKNIDQITLDRAAKEIYPDATPATRNRQVYTPILAILGHAGIATKFKRPKGAQGTARVAFLEPEQAWRVLDVAEATDTEMAALITFCLYTGCRASEALKLQCADVTLAERTAFVGKTKNGDPRAVHLPHPAVVALANHPRGLDRAGKVFHWDKADPKSSMAFYGLLKEIYAKAGVDPKGAPVHILRHTYATWMRRYANADERDLTDTGAWRDRDSVQRYTHTHVSEASKLADQMPTRAKTVR